MANATSKNTVATRDPREVEALTRVANLFDSVPQAGGDVFAFIDPILSATSAQDLIYDESETGSADQIEDYYGQLVRVDRIEWAESDYADAVGAISDKFVIVHAVALESQNREIVCAIGATTPLIKLLKLHSFGAFPAVVRFDPSSKKTRAGYTPQNMSVIKVSEPVNA